MRNRNARVIIPFALGAWLVAVVGVTIGLPPVVWAVLIVAFAVSVPAVVFYLLTGTGWRPLARRYRATSDFVGTWQRCATGQMALVPVSDPEFERVKARFIDTLRVGVGGEALHLSMLFSKVPLLGAFFPELRIPWSAVSSAHTFEAPGWFRPASQPGALVQAAYDPNYTGTFVEIAVGQPPVFIQLPEAILGTLAMGSLPLNPDDNRPPAGAGA